MVWIGFASQKLGSDPIIHRKGRVVMWQQCISHIREHPLSWVLIICVIAAVIYVFVHREQLFYQE